jgi:hypothetical protein
MDKPERFTYSPFSGYIDFPDQDERASSIVANLQETGLAIAKTQHLSHVCSQIIKVVFHQIDIVILT